MHKKCTYAEKFMYEFKKLANNTKLTQCETSFGYLQRVMFKDGSCVDSRTLLNYIGFNV